VLADGILGYISSPPGYVSLLMTSPHSWLKFTVNGSAMPRAISTEEGRFLIKVFREAVAFYERKEKEGRSGPDR